MVFKPTRADGKSYRDVAVELFKDQPVGAVIKYKQLTQVLDVPERHRLNAIVRSALRPMLKLHQRGLKCIPGIGYRVLEAKEHVNIAHKHQSKADKQMGRALMFYRGTNLSELTEAERKLHHGQYMLAEAVMASHRHLDKRISKIEELLRGGTTIEA